MSSVTVITSTTGRASLLKCVQSVADQTGPEVCQVKHLIIPDGPEAYSMARNLFAYYEFPSYVDVVQLPYAVGKDRWNGHRMYAAGTFLVDTDYVMYLDDDNFIDTNHIQECLAAIKESGAAWAYSLRKIVDQQGNFLCNDDCESLGRHHTVMDVNDFLVDVNCYFLSKGLAVQLTPVWYRKAREPGVMEVDRALINVLLQNKVPGVETGQYTVNYAVGGNALSVSPGFFIHGNKKMAEAYKGNFPWRKK
jgi:hypothetical protein